MSKIKTRPHTNCHCFEGRGLQFWQAIACGMRPSGFSNSRDGYRTDIARDVDGAAVQNGGKFAPQQTKMNPGTYFRFYGTISRDIYGDSGAVSGGCGSILTTTRLSLRGRSLMTCPSPKQRSNCW